MAWFQFTPTTTGVAVLRAEATDYPLALTTFVGSCDDLLPIACANPQSAAPASLVFEVGAGETYIVQVAACDSQGGQLQLALEICGDGVAALIDECDDGNNEDGDGCSAECRFEALKVDQQPIDGPFCNQRSAFVGIYARGPLAQEFRPTESELAAVDVSLWAAAPPEEDNVTVTIREGSIDGPVLGSGSRFLQPPRATVIGGGPHLWHHFTFSSPIPVVPRNTYVLEVGVTNASFMWQRGPCEYPGGNPIYGGVVSVDAREDFLFRTYAPQAICQAEHQHAAGR